MIYKDVIKQLLTYTQVTTTNSTMYNIASLQMILYNDYTMQSACKAERQVFYAMLICGRECNKIDRHVIAQI